ncbi:MAG: 6-carboxytetrahydropterin synthase QueD [bacterium]
MYEIMIEDYFSSAHKLKEYKGNCENLHGHNWKVQVFVKGQELDKLGILVDFRELKKEVKNILKKIDHIYLNELSFFKNINPTTENIAKFIFDSLKEKINVFKISVWESEICCAIYFE